jgi:hypothetical protein
MTQVIWTFALLFAPVPVLIVMGRIKMLRKRATEEDSAATRPFDPKPEPVPGLLLRRFSQPERTYLRQQVGAAKVGFGIVAWCVAVLTSSTLLPGGADNPYGWYAGDAALLWNGYLNSAFLLNPVAVIFGLITAMTAGFGLSATGPGMMNRTRPLTRRLLYWGRVGPALLTLLAAYATGIAVSLALLLALHGPVWRHLNVNGQELAMTLKQMRRLGWIMHVSLPRLLVSVATTSGMIFSTFLLLQQLPFGRVRVHMPKVVPLLFGLSFYVLFSQLLRGVASRVSGVFFLYGMLAKSPPPWTGALVPISITAAFLCIAQVLNRRSEP